MNTQEIPPGLYVFGTLLVIVVVLIIIEWYILEKEKNSKL